MAEVDAMVPVLLSSDKVDDKLNWAVVLKKGVGPLCRCFNNEVGEESGGR